MSLAPGTNLGPYEILASLGAGGMGEVYRARDHRLDRAVAIKVLSASQDTDPERRERFAREARAIARLSHPHICTLYDVGEERPRPAQGAKSPSASERGWGPASTDDRVVFLVMELVEGQTLAERLERGPLPLDRALSIAVQVAEALDAAHKKGVIHRDLKPANLMLTSSGVKLLDFGVAKLKEDAESASGETETSWVTDRETAVGTLPYMAPEQIEGREIDARTDIFAFGVMVFEMIAGRRPFGGNTRASLMASIVGAEPLSLADLQPATPPMLERLIGRCLAKDVELRWQTARDLATELRWFAETRPDKAAVAIPPAHWSRRAVIVGGLAAVAVLVAAFAAISGFIGRKQTPAAEYTQVTYRRGAVSSARFAPDGQGFVYSASWEGEPYRVFYGRAASPDARDLGLDLGRILSISRTNDMAVLFGPQSIVRTFGERTLASIPMAGGTRRDRLTGIMDADWIPGSDDFAVIRDPGGGRKWTVEFPAGKTVHETTAAWSLRVSPDGSRIAFLDGPAIFDGTTDGNVVVIDRTGKKTIVSRSWAAFGLAWAPSGREIWFTATHFEKHGGRTDDGPLRPPSLQAVSLEGEERSIQHAPDWLVLHDIAADGRVLVSRNTVHIGLSCQAPGESRERDLSWQIASFATGFSADGQTVVFNDMLGGQTSSGNAAVFSRNLDGSPAVRLGEGNGGRISPDKKWVLTQQGDHLVLLPTGAGSPVELPKGTLKQVGMGAWLGDSKRIVFTGYLDNDQPRGYIQEIPNGAPSPITPHGVELSPRAPVRDEHTVFGTSNNQRLLYPLEGGEPRPLSGVPPTVLPIQWSDDGRFVYAIEGGGGPIGPPGLNVVRIELSTGRSDPWKTLVHSDTVGLERQRTSVMIAPDGRSYCYSYMRRLGNLFILDGLK